MAAFINRDHVGAQCHDIGCFPANSPALYGVETISRLSQAQVTPYVENKLTLCNRHMEKWLYLSICYLFSS